MKNENTYDIIIKNGNIVDGTGAPYYVADIAVKNGKIAYIGTLTDENASTIIDAKGKYVTPGFIDSHTHSDGTLWCHPEFQNAVRQGVTTEIVGNCGNSMKHSLRTTPFDPACDGIVSVYDLFGTGKPVPKGAMAAVLDKAEKLKPSVNLAWLCGHNDIRLVAGATGKEVTEEQFKIMEDLLREALEAGFIGFSTGLEFDPGVNSEPEEVERLAKIVAEYDGNYCSHMRDEGTYIIEAVEEFLNVVRKNGIRGTVSHLNVKYDNGIPNEYLDKCMQMLKDAREKENLNVYADMLPTCFASGLAMAILPPWLYADGVEKLKEVLSTHEGRDRVKNDLDRYWRFLGAGQWDRLINLTAGHLPEYAGLSFKEIVEKIGKEPVECFLDVIASVDSMEQLRNIGMQANVFHEQIMIDSVVRDPIYMWMTDSSVTGLEHPTRKPSKNVQAYMSMIYFFTRYVRDLGAISIEKAVNKVTGMPAEHYRLANRGVLKEGNYADINVFDIKNLKINSDFANPSRYSEGFDWVIVNGEPVVIDSEHTGNRPGRVLRREQRRAYYATGIITTD